MLCRLSVVFTLLVASAAAASSRPYAWAYTTDTGLEGDSGTELWVSQRHALAGPLAADYDGWDLWWGFTTVPTENVELAFYTIGGTVVGGSSPASSAQAYSAFAFVGLEAQGRWHLAGPLLLLGKVDYFPGFGLGGTLLVVLEHRFEKFLLTANAGAALSQSHLSAVPQKLWATADAALAASVSVTESFRLGVEATLQAPLQGKAPFGAFIGPTLFYGKGKLWAALNSSYGVSYTPAAPAIWSRLVIGAGF